MNLIEAMKQNNIIINTKGGKYYKETYNSNLDVFTMLSRESNEDTIIRLFNNALKEDENLALANLLYILDIRNGKGERRLFKVIFKNLCLNNPSLALKVLPHINELGRYDYILEGLNTPIETDVLKLIKKQIQEDKKTDNPSLLAKWLPSHRTHNKNNVIARKIMKELKINEKEYRKTLSNLRTKINIVEKNLTNKEYKNIIFKEVPTKAMLKYNEVFKTKITSKYEEYKNEVKKGNAKINTEGLFSYEIIRNIMNHKGDNELYDLMWNNQKDVLKGCNKNILVMADTSGSMMCYGGIPYYTSIGLALYTAERNNGIFKNHFMTFSSEPYLCEIKGKTIEKKVNNIPCYIDNTNIDKAFELLLNTAIKEKIKEEEMPSHILIISDMEFNDGVYSSGGTHFNGFRKAFNDAGYNLPKIIFWNVAGCPNGLPVTKFDNDVIMVSGFSTNILDNLLTLENYNPVDLMLEKLSIYLKKLD